MTRRQLNILLAAFLVACGTDVPPLPEGDVVGDPASNFHRVYGDPALRERFFLFLKNVFHLFPEDDFHALIGDVTRVYATDREIYEQLLTRLPAISPPGSAVTFAVPALEKQKDEMARQAAALLGEGAKVDGYLEIGSTGRYFRSLKERVPIEGDVFVCNDAKPGNTPADLVERGQVPQVGTFVPLGNYDPLEGIADGTLDLVSNLIGFHHCPADRLDGFVDGIRRVLRPGGRLLLREHDVRDETMDVFVALAHDVFNAGVFLSWDDNAAQVRGFRSVEAWTLLLEARGFARSPDTRLQEGDPTDNTMLVFTRA